MAIKLPRDAEGREIPLDTVALYDDDGNVHSVRRFIYTTDFDLGDKWMNSWVMVVDDYKTAKPEQMYLTKPDSLKQLAEDLNRAWDACNVHGKGYRDMSCHYDKGRGEYCNDCRLNSHGKTMCFDAMMADIISRVNRLAGDSE